MKDSGIPWIGEIPEGWSVCRLKNYFTLHGRIGWNGLRSDEFEENSYAYLVTGQDFTAKEIDWNRCYQIRKERYDEDEYIQLSDGDILVTKDGTIGKTAVVTKLNKPACLNSGIFVVKPKDTSIFNPNYFYWLLESPLLKSFNNYMNLGGTTIIHLYQNIFERMPLVIPSKKEQEIIADYLDRKCSEIDKMIALEEKVIEELKAYKQSVITEAVTKGLNPDVPMKDSGIEWIGKIPEHWNTSRLKKIANKRVEKSNEHNLNYIGLENLASFSEEMVETENIYGTEGANVCCEGDVIFGKLRPYLGKVKVIKDRCYCSTEFLVLKNNDCPKYLRYLMLSEWFIEIVNASTYGTKMPRANTDFILNMSVPIPPLDDKKNIVSYLENKCSEIDSLVSIKNSKIKELKNYKKSIIYEYVTGKREVQ